MERNFKNRIEIEFTEKEAEGELRWI